MTGSLAILALSGGPAAVSGSAKPRAVTNRCTSRPSLLRRQVPPSLPSLPSRALRLRVLLLLLPTPLPTPTPTPTPPPTPPLPPPPPPTPPPTPPPKKVLLLPVLLALLLVLVLVLVPLLPFLPAGVLLPRAFLASLALLVVAVVAVGPRAPSPSGAKSPRFGNLEWGVDRVVGG